MANPDSRHQGLTHSRRPAGPDQPRLPRELLTFLRSPRLPASASPYFVKHWQAIAPKVTADCSPANGRLRFSPRFRKALQAHLHSIQAMHATLGTTDKIHAALYESASELLRVDARSTAHSEMPASLGRRVGAYWLHWWETQRQYNERFPFAPGAVAVINEGDRSAQADLQFYQDTHGFPMIQIAVKGDLVQAFLEASHPYDHLGEQGLANSEHAAKKAAYRLWGALFDRLATQAGIRLAQGRPSHGAEGMQAAFFKDRCGLTWSEVAKRMCGIRRPDHSHKLGAPCVERLRRNYHRYYKNPGSVYITEFKK